MKWAPFVAYRWMNLVRQDKSMTSSLLSVGGISLGVIALTVVLGVMNGFQSGFIESIIEIGSFHVQARVLESDADRHVRSIAAQPDVVSVLPFAESQELVRGKTGEPLPVVNRAIPLRSSISDLGFLKKVNLLRGRFPENGDEILIGEELAYWLRADVGGSISMTTVRASEEDGLVSESRSARICGIFKSGYYEYDMSRTFSLLVRSPNGENEEWTLGIKIKNRDRDRHAMADIAGATGLECSSWKEYNRSFFNALKMEKNLMMAMIAFIFLVVSVNVYHALRRSVLERLEEIGVLRAMGASARGIRSVFVLEGFFLGLAGIFVGTLFGVFIANNVNEIFGFLETVVNSAGAWWRRLTGMGGTEGFSLFSPKYFYISDVPVRVYPGEVVFICLMGLGSSTFAAFFASNKVSAMRPQEVLRNE